MKPIFCVVAIITTINAIAQSELPYREIPAYPEKYTAATVAARMIDGLGFRYYWATEGLTEKDLVWRPGAEARTTRETLEHILGLTNIVINSVNGVPNVTTSEIEVLPFDAMRKKTLENLKVASEKLKSDPNADLAKLTMVFSGTTTREFPFWNEINGPISDALWHVGQVVSFRRSSGNPFNSKVSVLQGKLRE